jgi:4-amino-4-deoxy-L-arabinose transferase-like glycosyltransferase
MEWLDRGSYTLEPQHPPLARVAAAIGPFLHGLRSPAVLDLHENGLRILYARRTSRTLALARLGTLPFFVLAAWIAWYWSRRLFGDAPALLATAMFTNLPPILAHGGLATTDMALTAIMPCFVLATSLWLDRPSIVRSTVVGASAGVAVLAKFSAVIFLPACAVSMVALRLAKDSTSGRIGRTTAKPFLRTIVLISIVGFVVIWAGYRFSLHPLSPATGTHPKIDGYLGSRGRLRDTAYFAAESIPLPAVELLRGINDVRQHNAAGHPSYLLGQCSKTGWWYFFPVALAVKSPLGFLGLAGAGALILLARAKSENWQELTPPITAAALLVICLPSRINIGVRHILPIYPLLAIMGGYAAHRIAKLRSPRYLGPAVVIAMLGWQIWSSVVSHPDYLAFFNELAGRDPARILINSDLDWGQDLQRLSTALRARHVQTVSLAYLGTASLNYHDLPTVSILPPYQPTTGWVAISEMKLKGVNSGAGPREYGWLQAYEPVTRIGRSMWLYYIPESGAKSNTAEHSSRDTH